MLSTQLFTGLGSYGCLGEGHIDTESRLSAFTGLDTQAYPRQKHHKNNNRAGGTSGLGKEAALELSLKGARVIFACR